MDDERDTAHDGWATVLRWSTGGDLPAASLWFEQAEADAPRASRDPLDGDTTADVVVVGGGLTGLWTAYSLLEADPALDVLVVEGGVVGWGASGRTGGWYGAGSPASAARLAAAHGPDAARSARAALRDAVVEVGGVAAAEQVDCDLAVGGLLTLARTPAQLARLTGEAAAARAWGDEVELLDADAVAGHAHVEGALGGTLVPDAGRLQPVRLARGLLDVLTAHGARVVEGTRALRLSPGAVVTDQGTVRAPRVVRATGAGPAAGAVHAVATEPLPAAAWPLLGLRRGVVLRDGGHRPVRALRTGDDRLVVSVRTGRAPAAPSGQDLGPVLRLHRALVDLLPGAAAAALTHAWGGAVTGDDRVPAVGFDAATGLAWADGAGEDGIAAGNVAGRTVADLLTGADTALTRLPWVGRGPLPGGGALPPARRRGSAPAAAARAVVAGFADREERLTGRPSRLGRVVGA